MSLGAGAYKVGGAGQCSSMKSRYPWQPHEWPLSGTVTLNNSEEYLPTNIWPLLQGGGRDGKNQSTKQAIAKHFAKNCKQATVYTSLKVPLLEALGHPKNSWKHCWPALLQG